MKTTIAAVLAAVTGTAIAGSNITCAKGLYMLAVRGSGEPHLNPNPNPKYKWPLDTGTAGIIALAVQQKVQGSVIAGVDYPAADPINELTDAVNLTVYYPSENQGAKTFMDDVDQYHSACPDSKIALLGYSQVRLPRTCCYTGSF